ncbi:MAG: septal ring lytic transglycosylase RlpA family protein [Acidimicrobiales bacterium]
MVVPLLLLATPGRAATHGDVRAQRGALAGAWHHSTASSGAGSAHAALAPTWAAPIVVPADFQAPAPTTTTTTAPPPTTTTVPRPVVHSSPPPAPTTTTTAPKVATAPAGSGHSQTGQASWYQAQPGTCASPSLSFGTVVTVTDLSNGKSVTCTVDDRQSTSTGRILDLAEATFAQLADPSVGVIEVRLTW